MNWRSVFFTTLALSGICHAEVSSNQVARVREGLIRLGAAGYRANDSFRLSFDWLLKREGLPVEPVLSEVEKLALEADGQLAPDKLDASEEDWVTVCSRMLAFLGDSGDRRFLPTIERLALNAHDEHNRADAVRAYIAICGFESLPLVQWAIAAVSYNPDRPDTRFTMVQLLLEKMNEESTPRENIEAFGLYLLRQAETERHAQSLVLADKFLLKQFPEYAHSWQRLALVSRRDIEYLSSQSYEYFYSVGAEIARIPPDKRADLCGRFRGLSPLPEKKDEAFAPPLDDATVTRKLKEIIIREAFFHPPATIIDAVYFLKYASRDYDESAPPGKRKGVDFVLQIPNVGDYVPGFSEKCVPYESWLEFALPIVSVPTVHSVSLNDLLARVCDVSGMTFKIKNGRVVVLPKDNVQDGGGAAVRGIVTLDTRTHKLLLAGGEPDRVMARPEKADRRFDFIAGSDPCDCGCGCMRNAGDGALQPVESYLRTANLSVTPKNGFPVTGGSFTVTGVVPSHRVGGDAFTWRTGCHYNQGTYTVVDLKLSFADAESNGMPRRVFVGQTNVIHILTDIPPLDVYSRNGTLSFDNGFFVSDTIMVKNCLKGGGYDALPSEIPESDWFSKYARTRYTAEILYVATDPNPGTRIFKVTYSLPGVGSVSTSLNFEVERTETEKKDGGVK